MKIYFAGSIRGGRNDQEIYFKIIDLLKNYGEVLTEHIGLKTLESSGETKTNKFIFDRDVTWIKQADIIIAEVSTPSLGVGYELGISEYLNKKVICLFRPEEGKKLSAMAAGNKKFIIKEYKKVSDIKIIFDEIFAK